MRSLKAPVLDQVHEMLAKGWLSSHVPVLNPFYAHRDEIRVQSGCLMRGIRVIVTPKLCPQVLQELHRGHLGGVEMKSHQEDTSGGQEYTRKSRKRRGPTRVGS